MPLEPMYGWADAAALLKISIRRLREMVRQGRFPEPHRSGKMARWMESEIREWQVKFTLGMVPPPKKPGAKE